MGNSSIRLISCFLLLLINQPISAAQDNLQATQKQKLIIISHPDTKQDSIDKNTLRAMFSMNLQEWSGGEGVKVFVLEDRDKLHLKFSKSLLGFFPYQLRRSWDRLTYSGTGEGPTSVKNIEIMKQRIASTVGAIGYVPADLVDKSVKILRIK